MYTEKPVLWFNPNRISLDTIAVLQRNQPWMSFIPVRNTSAWPPCGYVSPRYPTPDELFRWKPEPKLVVIRGYWQDCNKREPWLVDLYRGGQFERTVSVELLGARLQYENYTHNKSDIYEYFEVDMGKKTAKARYANSEPW